MFIVLRRFPLRWPRFEEDLSFQAPGGGLSAIVVGKVMSKSLGTFCKFGSANETRPVAVCVWLNEWIRGMLSLTFKHFSFCSGNTIFVNAELILRHSIISPGSGWSGFSLSRTSLLVLGCLVTRDVPRLVTPKVLRLVAWLSSSRGSSSSTNSTYRGRESVKYWASNTVESSSLELGSLELPANPNQIRFPSDMIWTPR